MNDNMSAAADDILAILHNIEAIKGVEYAAVLRGIFGMSNYHQAMQPMVDALPQSLQMPYSILQEVYGQALGDITRTMLMQLIKLDCTDKSKEDIELVLHKKIAEVMGDIKTLSDAQDKNGTITFPHNPV